MHHTRPLRVAEGSLIVLVAALAAVLCVTPAAGQGCGADWSRPVVCSVELSATQAGERRAVPSDGRTLELPPRSRIELYANPIDQWGRSFPLERFEMRADAGHSCTDLVSLELRDEGRLLIETGSRTGTCDLLLWVPGNLNLDRELRLEVSHSRVGGFSRAESELLAGWLFQALLERDPDPGGLRAATMEIQRNGLRNQVESMIRSPEFRKRRAGLPAEQLLEDVYRGLLGRLPDSAGVRSHLPRVQRGDLAGVVLTLLGSEEFEERLDRKLD